MKQLKFRTISILIEPQRPLSFFTGELFRSFFFADSVKIFECFAIKSIFQTSSNLIVSPNRTSKIAKFFKVGNPIDDLILKPILSKISLLKIPFKMLLNGKTADFSKTRLKTNPMRFSAFSYQFLNSFYTVSILIHYSSYTWAILFLY